MGLACLGTARHGIGWIENTAHQSVTSCPHVHSNAWPIVGLLHHASHGDRQLEGDPPVACDEKAMDMGAAGPAVDHAVQLLGFPSVHLVRKSRSVAIGVAEPGYSYSTARCGQDAEFVLREVSIDIEGHAGFSQGSDG